VDAVSREPSAIEEAPLWYRPVLTAMAVVDGARRGVRLLQLISLTVAATAVIGNSLEFFQDPTSVGANGFSVATPADRANFGDFLSALSLPLGLAAMIFGFSFVLKNAVARLNLDMVLANQQATHTG
jgi:hypothetical protein